MEDRVTDSEKVNMTQEDGPVVDNEAPTSPVGFDGSMLKCGPKKKGRVY